MSVDRLVERSRPGRRNYDDDGGIASVDVRQSINYFNPAIAGSGVLFDASITVIRGGNLTLAVGGDRFGGRGQAR